MLGVNKMSFDKSGVKSLLSPLECDVLEILWKKEQSRVRELHKILKRRRKVALTSVAVILDRLHKKGIVERKVEVGRGGAHYIYFPKFSKATLEQSIIEKTVNKLIDDFGSAAVTYFNERFRGRKK